MKTAIYTLIFIFFSTSLIHSQTSLEGTITNASTGEPILFGTVGLYKDNTLLKGTQTDLDGNYFFGDIEAGTYDVEATYTGYTAQKQTGVIVKKGIKNRLDFTLSEGVLMDAIEVVEYKIPLIEVDRTTSGSTVTAESIRSLPTKNINAMASSVSGVSTTTDKSIAIRGSRSGDVLYYTDGIRFKRASDDMKPELPESGQMTAGEWNDLHKWRDWMDLIENEDYSIMMERFSIRPIERYSVLVVNESNAVLANVRVQLLDRANSVIWEAFTDNSGKAELWENAFDETARAASIRVDDQKKKDIVTIEEGSNTFVLSQECYSPEKMDIVFTVDATSSMNDEISYLKSELLDVIDRIKSTNKAIDFNIGSVFYRDRGDAYLTRVSSLTDDIEKTVNFVKMQNSSGGGDNPEAVESALEETLNLDWRKDALKLVFLILDAPPHEDDATMDKIRMQIKEAASRGIKLIPVTASGIGRETEFLMKFMAILTNGTYVFITDDSGIGNPHLDPVVEDYEVEKLNDCLVRLVTQYSKSYSCDAEIAQENFDVDIYPNPATQYINVKADEVPTSIKIYSANGMLVKSIAPTEKNTRIEMEDFVNGIYTISVVIGNQIESKQIILLK